MLAHVRRLTVGFLTVFFGHQHLHLGQGVIVAMESDFVKIHFQDVAQGKGIFQRQEIPHDLAEHQADSSLFAGARLSDSHFWALLEPLGHV